MQIQSFPDSLKFIALRERGAELKNEVADAYLELTTGKLNNANISQRLNGRVGDAQLLRREIENANTRVTSLDLGAGRAALIQSSLTQIVDSVGSLPEEISSALGRGEERALELASLDARSSLDSVVSALNVRQGRRYLFSGDAVDAPTIPSAQGIVDGVRAAIAGLTTAADIDTALDTYFGAGGGFETTNYAGGTGDAPALELSSNDQVDIQTRGDDEAFRELIRGLTMASLVGESTLDAEEQEAFAEDANGLIISGLDNVATVIAETGLVEQRIEEAKARNETQTATMTDAYNAMVARDPFEAATRAQELQVQLETTYTVTSRLSQLSFANFL